MNNQVRKAVDAVAQLHTLVARLAEAPVTDVTRLLQAANDTSDFVEAVNTAQQAIEAALDEVDGPALKQFDFALDAVRRARAQFYTPVDENRTNTLTCVEFAVECLNKGVRAL